ncbi:24735_t:CDS:2, partial [Dentiscutata erythropus]
KQIRIKVVNPAVTVATYTKADGSVNKIFPNKACLRNLTYSCLIYVDVSCAMAIIPWNKAISSTFHKLCDKNETIFTQKVFIRKIPVMVRSIFCNLHGKTKKELINLNKCLYEGGYFIINGSEKVLIAQEQPANNYIFVFEKLSHS